MDDNAIFQKQVYQYHVQFGIKLFSFKQCHLSTTDMQKIIYNHSGIFEAQHKYATRVISKYGMPYYIF